MARFFVLIAAFLCIGSFTPVRVQAQAAPAASSPDVVNAAPNLVTQQWVRAVVGKDYATAWALLSAHSQDAIVTSIASDEKMDANDVRALFEKNDPRIVSGFWTSFRHAAKALRQLTDVPATVSSNDGTLAIVQFNGYPKQWKCFRENGAWKVGYMETFLDK